MEAETETVPEIRLESETETETETVSLITTESETETETEAVPDITSEAETESEAETTTEIATENETKEAGQQLDYVLGRPLTEEEKAEESALEPDLKSFPEAEVTIPSISDEIEAIGITDYAAAVNEYQNIVYDTVANGKNTPQVQDSVYDPRGTSLVTPVRTQLFNSCWAFTSMAAGEQSLLYQGVRLPGMVNDAASLDLSEAQLLYYFYHTAVDPMGNTAGDATVNTSSSDYLTVGSSTIFSTFAMANWVGAAKESTLRMEELTAESIFDDAMAYNQNEAVLENAYWINFSDTDAVQSVKQMILKYGGAAINLYYNQLYYNQDTKAYYFPLNPHMANNHSVTIVGWDDNYSKDNFNHEEKPSKDGAWIAKNSYGTGWGDQGYFYISYEDSSVNTSNAAINRARAFIFDFASAADYDNNYQYDGTYGAYNCSYPNSNDTRIASGSSVANVFHVSDESGTSTQTLSAVSIALYDTAVNYEIQIYKNPTDSLSPVSGTPMLSTPQTGSTSFVGYYTIPLDEQIELKAGDTFAVVFTLSKESSKPINVFMDATYANGSWISFFNATESGQSYKQVNGTWYDLGNSSMTARIKAFTNDIATTTTSIAFDMAGQSGYTEQNGTHFLEIWNDEDKSIQVKVQPADAKSQELQFTSSNLAVLEVDKNGKLIPVNAGQSIITVSTTDGSNLSLQISVTVKIRAAVINLSHKQLSLRVGQSQELQAVISPSEASEQGIAWNSSNSEVITVDDNGKIRARTPGTAIVTASTKDGSALTAECLITVQAAVSGNVTIIEDPEINTDEDGITIDPTYQGGTQDTTSPAITTSDDKEEAEDVPETDSKTTEAETNEDDTAETDSETAEDSDSGSNIMGAEPPTEIMERNDVFTTVLYIGLTFTTVFSGVKVLRLALKLKK